MLEFETKSGVECVINCADLKDARELRIAILEQFKDSKITQEQINALIQFSKRDASKSISDILFKDKNLDVSFVLNAFKDIYIVLDTSDRIYKALFSCLKRCTYDKESIREATFEKEEARADYYEIAVSCIVENIRPFVKSLLSGL